MARKIIKYGLLAIVIGLVAYKSVFIAKLSELQTVEPKAFDAPAYVAKLWDSRLPARLDSAISLDALQTAMKSNAGDAFKTYFNSMSIGNIRYGLVKLTGKVVDVNDDDVTVVTGNSNEPLTVKIATEYVYGNAIRDASRLVDIRDFVNTQDLNSISSALNKRIRNVVLPPFKSKVKKDDVITCVGAIELNEAHYSLSDLEIIPVQCKINQ